ncbi:transcriptional regulator [Rhizobium sp. AC44/96]|jgi:DNA-binding transcriptional ArsR family regulator|uniref:ArsR/SmtB family transcription factor n=1 Tax=Rhizobium sp. AC44/96 TaxID=1841654 RepID=UPI0008101101|nr:metalloregulator ArsR/SmtB family transcription factor [Rhizobium sp. AC44/96]OCJ16452.1 transcriptional regulator [Rhizobium sp. AC44/96]
MTGMVPSLEEMQDKAAEAAEFMRVFSTPSRLMLLCYIAQRERSVSEIQEDLHFKQPALSQQLADLRQAGLVETRRQSRQIYYSIADGRVAIVMNMLVQMFCETPAAVEQQSAAVPAATRHASGGGGTSSLEEMAHWARLDVPTG